MNFLYYYYYYFVDIHSQTQLLFKGIFVHKAHKIVNLTNHSSRTHILIHLDTKCTLSLYSFGLETSVFSS